MNILIVKTSSLGDIIHTLPALTDARKYHPNIQFDWVVEENFSEIPKWHPQVRQVIPLAWRKWRKNMWSAWQDQALQDFYHRLRSQSYDLIIDAQGLVKSSLVTFLAKGVRCGLDYTSARESWASWLYQKKVKVLFEQHAITRARQLFALALDYDCPQDFPDYAIRSHFLPTVGPEQNEPYILFIHGTTWKTKEWAETYWIALAHRCVAQGWWVKIPWGNNIERERAERIAATHDHIQVLPKASLSMLAQWLLQAKAAVAVDTGIGHLAAALSVPTLSLYGPTDPDRTGALGEHQIQIRHTSDMASISVDEAWEKLKLF